MKVIYIVLIFLSLVVTIPSEAFLDIFTTYGKRNNQIDKIIVDALNTQKIKWKRTRDPIAEKYDSWCAYAPFGDSSKIVFNFTEMHRANHPNYHTLDGLFTEAQETAKESSGTNNVYNSDQTITRNKTFFLCNIISRSENTLCYERLKYTSKQIVKYQIKENLFGEREEEIICTEQEIIDEIPKGYVFDFIIDLGGGEFREYSYWRKEAGKCIPSEDEKRYLLELFQYMEEQIKNVRA